MDCTYDISGDSLQGQAINFLQKEGIKNVAKVFDESSYTLSNKAKFKNSASLLNMLQNTSELFKKHGLFIHKGNPKIMQRNIEFFENLYTTERLVSGINTKAQEAGLKHNVISSKKFQGNYYLLMHGDSFINDKSVEWHNKQKQKTLQENIDYIKRVNKYMSDRIGQDVISVTKTTNGYRVNINEDSLLKYNELSYRNYLNSMTTLFDNNDSYTEEHDLLINPIIQDLYKDRSSFSREKYLLEAKGGKKSDINILDNKINKIETTIETLKKSEALDDIFREAFDNFSDIDIILSKDKISNREFIYSKKKLEMWQNSGDFSKGTHAFLDTDELGIEEYTEKFGEIRNEAEKRLSKLLKLGESLLESTVNNKLNWNSRLGFNQITKLVNKINVVGKKVLSLNRVGNALAQFIHKIVNEANNKAFIESKIKSRSLANLYSNVKNSGFDLNLFYQKDEDGTRTGDLTTRFSSKYSRYKNNIKKNTKRIKDNMILLNPAILFGEEEAEKDALVNLLTEHLGEQETNRYIEKARIKFDEYKEIRNEYVKVEFETIDLSLEQELQLQEWEQENSPIAYINSLNTTKQKDTSQLSGKSTFLIMVPKRFNEKGEETGFYDKTFDSILASKPAYEFYIEAKEILENAAIAFGSVAFDTESLGFVQKSLLEKYNETGIIDFITEDVYKSLVKDLISEDSHPAKTNLLTGKVEHNINVNVQSIKTRIHSEYSRAIKALGVKEEDLTSDQKSKVYKEASDKVFQENSENLFMSLNMLNLAVLSAKHKHNVEDAVNLAMTYLPNSTVEIGDDYVDSAGNPIAEKYINNMMEMAEYFLSMSYYDEGKVDTSATLYKIQTKEEKLKVKEIDKLLSQTDLTPENRAKLEEEKKTLGKRVTMNGMARRLLDILRLKALGWNVPAAITNYMYGKLTNLYKAADGRLFNIQDLAKAEKIIISENKKFNHVIENYGILGDILFEFKDTNKFEEKDNWFMKSIKQFKPYSLQTGTEKHNQGSVMVAMMLHQKVKDSETGEEKDIWDAILPEGILEDRWTLGEFKGEDAIVEMVSRIKSQVEEIHGDYSNPLLIKSSVSGQALSMFKLWFFEAFYNRFGRERPDYIRGISIKGRYRTLTSLLAQYKGNIFKVTSDYKNGKLSEVDAANMRVNLVELTTMILAVTLAALLKGAICDDDDDCKGAGQAELFTLNMMKRLTGEISFFTSPENWYKFISNPVAAANVLNDMVKATDIAYIQLFGEDEQMEFQAGYRKGTRKDWALVRDWIPMYNQFKRLQHYSGEVLNL